MNKRKFLTYYSIDTFLFSNYHLSWTSSHIMPQILKWTENSVHMLWMVEMMPLSLSLSLSYVYFSFFSSLVPEHYWYYFAFQWEIDYTFYGFYDLTDELWQCSWGTVEHGMTTAEEPRSSAKICTSSSEWVSYNLLIIADFNCNTKPFL